MSEEKPGRTLKLKVVCAGPHGADPYLVDATTGERITLDGHVRLDVGWHPDRGGTAQAVAVFTRLPVEVQGEQTGPFELQGCLVGGRAGPLPAGVRMAPPELGVHTEGSSVRVLTSQDAAMAANERANLESPRHPANRRP